MLQLRVRDLRWEADGVLSLGLADVAGGPLPEWSPGAHIELEVSTGLNRSYSLCSDPADRTAWRVAVLREPESRGGSAAVHDRVRPGDVLSAREPRNDFPLVEAQTYQFIAGGIGITPIIPMLEAANTRGAAWHLLYGGRRRASMAFLDELARYGDHVTVAPEDEQGLLDLDGALADWEPGTAVYCCGPGPLLTAVEERCHAAGLPAGTLRVEHFTPVVSAEEARTGSGFEVQLEKSGLTVSVDDGQTIIEAVEAAGVTVDCSCLEGTCGTCETTVLEGIPDHRDSILTDDERAANDTMMICVSRALSPSLKLDL
ncbi:MAG TPA: PDR/VanB family oxidoreductase [Baekduia sp.]|nr:PDR/VanB family oxidoreductase [Baekduia sp.]